MTRGADLGMRAEATAAIRRRRLWLVAVWFGVALYLLPFVDRGWIPNDEGILGHSAARVLDGELPHRDFHDLYTGLLSMWNALAFRVLGFDLLSIRWFLYLSLVAFVPVLFGLARRAVPPALAAIVTFTAVAWSVPNYFAGMPSWYNLLWTLGGVLALVRHVETGRRRWLVVAGLCGGVSFLVKSAGLLFIAAALLFLVFREQELSSLAGRDSGPLSPAGRGRRVKGENEPGPAFPLFVTACLLAFVIVLTAFVSQRPGPMEFLHFVLPPAALSVLLVARTWTMPGTEDAGRRLRRLFGLGLPFGLGLAAPCVLFLIPYAARGGVMDWLGAGFLFQPSRLEFGVWALPGPATLVCAVPLVLLFALPLRRGWRPRWARPLFWAALLGGVLVLAWCSEALVYQSVWFALRPLVPLLVVIGCIVLWRTTPSSDPIRRQILFLLLAAVACFSVIQFPFSRALYFCFAAPLVILAYAHLCRALPRGAPRRLHLAVLGFHLCFALLWLNTGWVEAMERQVLPMPFEARLSEQPGLEHADLRVTPRDAALYGHLVRTVHTHSAPGEAIWAGPDCPEIYFLTGRRNPTGTLLDYLDAEFGGPDRSAHTDRILDLLEAEDIDVVVLRRRQLFTPPDERLVAAVEARYPGKVMLPPYSVHWR